MTTELKMTIELSVTEIVALLKAIKYADRELCQGPQFIQAAFISAQWDVLATKLRKLIQ
jgi:hypothetical protein